MSATRKALGAVAVTIALLAGAACTGPPPTQEQVGEALGDGIGWILTILVANIACSLNPGCPSPICALFPCTPVPQGLEAPSPQVDPVGGG
jgi:hypothetical protein